MTDTLQALENAREKRGIPTSYFSTLVGFSSDSGWSTAVKRGSVSEEKIDAAVDVIAYYDEHGVIPEPSEIKTGGRSR